MKEIKTLTTLDEIKAFSDPYRVQILRCLKQFGEPATVKQIADEMGEVPAKVHYHVKKLEKVGILELVYTKEINGIIAKYYSPTAKSFAIKNSDYESPTFKLFLDKTQTLIANVFDDAKSVFLNQLNSSETDKSEIESENGVITSSYVYLTKDQYLDVQKYIKELSNENNKKESEDREKYFILSSIIKIKNDEKD